MVHTKKNKRVPYILYNKSHGVCFLVTSTKPPLLIIH